MKVPIKNEEYGRRGCQGDTMTTKLIVTSEQGEWLKRRWWKFEEGEDPGGFHKQARK